jgi:hypothetical protein
MKVTDNVRKLIFIFISILAFQSAEAQLEIEIISGNPSALPIAIVPFQWLEAGPGPSTSVDEIVSGDLYRSGLFKPMAVEDMAEKPVEEEGIRFGTWRLLKVDYIRYPLRDLAAFEGGLHRDRESPQPDGRPGPRACLPIVRRAYPGTAAFTGHHRGTRRPEIWRPSRGGRNL